MKIVPPVMLIDSSPYPLPFTRREEKGERLHGKTQDEAVEVAESKIILSRSLPLSVVELVEESGAVGTPQFRKRQKMKCCFCF